MLPHTEFHDDVLEFFRDEIKLAFDDEKLEGGSEPGSLALSVAQSLHEAEVDLHILCQSTKEDVTFILQEIADVDDKEVSRTITVIMEKLARKKKTVKPKVWPLRKKREDDGEPARLSDDEDGAEEGLLPPPPPVGAALPFIERHVGFATPMSKSVTPPMGGQLERYHPMATSCRPRPFPLK